MDASTSSRIAVRLSPQAFFGILAGGTLCVLLFTVKPLYAAVLALAGILLYAAVRFHRVFTLFLLVAFLHGLEINLSRYAWARDVPYLAGLNAPVVDFLAVILLLSLLLRILFMNRTGERLSFPFGWRYALFIGTALVSAYGAIDYEDGSAMSHVFRDLVFPYAAFVVLPCALLTTKERMFSALRTLAWVAYATALFGFISLFVFQFGESWFRVVPFGFFGIAPFGYNHNLIAEPLVALFPVTLYFFLTARDAVEKKWRLWGSACVLSVALLTLSRAAWVALAAQAFFFGWWYRQPMREALRAFRAVPILVGGGILLAAYMAVFLGSSVVASSNASRFDAAAAVLAYVNRAPWFGYGPGSYVPVLEETAVFVLEYGDPLDAHGFIQKLLLETGVLGFALFSWFLASVFRVLFRAAGESGLESPGDGRVRQALFLMALGAVVFQLFNTSYFNANMWLPIGIALAAIDRMKDSKIERLED